MTSDRGRQGLRPTEIVEIPVHDGIKIAAAVYRPPEPGRYPALLAASPYRFDNNLAPAVPVFLWRETGPIDYYLRHGYAFVHMDVRGTGRSQGEYRYMDEAEQRDLHDVIVWITQQPWSSGKVGGIGQSYYARMQWFMGIQNPPGLACIAPYDGNVDTYRNSAFTGGIPGAFPSTWYNSTTRAVNQYPIDGPSRLLTWDYPGEVQRHPIYDRFLEGAGGRREHRQDQGAGLLDRGVVEGRPAPERQHCRVSASARAQEAPGVRLVQPVRGGRRLLERGVSRDILCARSTTAT